MVRLSGLCFDNSRESLLISAICMLHVFVLHSTFFSLQADKQTPNLSGEKVTLVSKSGGKFELAKEIAEQAQLIRNIIAVPNDGDGGGSGSGSGSGSDDAAAGNVEVPVRVVEDDILAKVISFMTHHFDNPMQEIEKPIPSDKMEDIASDPFDRVRTQQRCFTRGDTP